MKSSIRDPLAGKLTGRSMHLARAADFFKMNKAVTFEPLHPNFAENLLSGTKQALSVEQF